VLAVFAAVSAVAQFVAAILGGSPETAQIFAMAIEVVLLGPLSAALGFALYLGLARSERPRA
jgi:biotin transporter BioY